MYKICTILLFLLVAAHSKKSFRIVNGDSVGHLVGYEVQNNGSFPYMVRVQSLIEGVRENGTQFMTIINCGGSIIRLNIVLTAAHCLILAVPEKLLVYAGMLNTEFLYFEPAMEITGVRRIVIHENFNKTYMDSDIALLFLDQSLTQSDHVKPLLLPTPWHYILGVPATVSGWGSDENGHIPNWLQNASLVRFPRTICQTYTEYNITEGMICAIDPNHTWSVCRGDSGGPLVLNNHVIGIISWAMKPLILPNGKISCDPIKPTVFVNVLHFVPWIESKIEEDKSTF